VSERRRRPAGQGAVIHRPDGRWEGRYSVEINGRRVQRSVYAAKEKEAVAKLAAALGKRAAGLVEGKRSRVTLAEWLDAWLADCQGRVRPTTYRRYADITRLHLSPALGSYQVAALTPQHVNGFLTAKLAARLAPRSVAHLRAVLRTALTAAMAADLVTRNVAQLARSPKVPVPERKDWTAADVEAVLAAVAGTDEEAPVAVSLLAGLRQGEVLGLRWADIDLAGHSLQVRQALQRQAVEPGSRRREFVAVQPKSRTSRRRVPLNDRLGLDPLEADDYAFTAPDCRPVEGTALTKRFEKRLGDAGLPARTWHDLRHGFASRLADAGVDLLVISRLLGHSGVGITATTYTRDPRAQMAAAVARLG
jgi:integrase